MNITITKDFGNFDVTAKLTVTDEQRDELAKLGALYIFERAPSSAVEQKVFAPMLGWSKGERGTSYQRPAGFKRNSVAFTPDLALEVEEAYNTTPGKLGDDEIKFTITNVVQHEGGGEVSRKMATEMAEQVKALPEGTAKTGQLMFLGVDGKDESALIEACHKFLSGLRKKKS